MITHYHHGHKGELIMGEGCHIAPTADFDLTGSLIIQNDVSISNGAKIFTHKHDYSKSRRKRSASWTLDETYTVYIEGDVFIGIDAIIIGARNIGEGAIIGAGSVVTKDVPPYEIWAGNPARKVNVRQV